MSLNVEEFQAEIDTVLDAKNVEAETAVGIRGAEVSEDTSVVSEDVGSQVVDTDVGVKLDLEAEEVEAKKVLDEEDTEETGDEETDTDDKTSVQFDDTVLARAVACGITLSEAQSFPDNAVLSRFVDSVEKNLTHEADSKKESAKDDDDAETDLFAGLPKLNPDEYSPEVVKTLDHFREVLLKQQEQLKAYEARTDSVQESMHDAGEREMVGWFDTAVDGLGDDYKEALGEGAFGSLSETSQGFANRNDIAGHMALMHDGYVAQGRVPPDRDELFDVAVRTVLSDAHSGIQQRKLEGELEQQASQHIQRVRGAKGKSTKSPEDETAALLNDKYDFVR